MGKLPWAGLSALQTALAIADGRRLPKPARASNDVYQLMWDCWMRSPDARPPFEQVHARWSE